MHPLTDAFVQGRAKFKKKEVGHYFDKPKNPRAACHLGAIWYGVYHNTNYEVGPLTFDFPELLNHVPVPCGETLETEGEIRSILVHLSDDHDGRSGWTDEKVAEWLESALA